MPSRLLAALLTAAALLLPATAHAAPSAEIGVADDRIMLTGTDEEISRATDEWRAAGVDVVRLFARWASHVPEPESRTAPTGFDPADQASPGYRWLFLDRAIDAVRSRGMRVVLTVTGSGPLWASADPSRGNPRYKPVPEAFAKFATAVATRYREKVDRYVVWNEPNLPLWLQPQSTLQGSVLHAGTRRTSTGGSSSPARRRSARRTRAPRSSPGRSRPAARTPARPTRSSARWRSCGRWAASTRATAACGRACAGASSPSSAEGLRLPPARAASRARPSTPATVTTRQLADLGRA